MHIYSRLGAHGSGKILRSSKHLPRWLTKPFDYGDGEKTRIPLFDHPILDHFEQRTVQDEKDGTIRTIYISQPYNLYYSLIKKMIEICEQRGIRFNITGLSDHSPGSTFLIEWSNEK